MGTSVITGANRGIGLELCRQLKARGDEVVAVVRKSAPELDALGVRVEAEVDVTDDASVARLGERLAGVDVSLLINNAGILTNESLGSLSFERIRAQLEVNALGPLRVTAALLPRMSKGAKIAIVTSRMGSIGDNTSGARYGYRMSKAAVNAAGKSLAMDLGERGIAVALLHPGFVKTDMTGHNGTVEPEEAARGLIARIDELTMANTGTFWHMSGEVLPW